MRFKLVILFLLTVLIPTIFLVHFSLLAVKSEQEFVEKQMTEKYQAIAGVVLADIADYLNKIPAPIRNDPKVINPLLFKHTQLFKNEVMIFDSAGMAVDGISHREDFGPVAYVSKIKDLPYEIAVYERYPDLMNQFVAAKEKVNRHVGMVSLSALAILLGGLFTLAELFRVWHKTELKADFISHLVHDLRGPLTSVRMFSDMLVNNRVPNEEKRRSYYQIIFVESEKLLQLADNILDFSHIENRGLRYPLKPENLAVVVKETIARFQSHLVNDSHKIVADVDTTLPNVPLHSESISHALMNLMANAVKYSPPDTTVRVVLARAGNKAVLSVIDQGIGIPKKEWKKIFREYYRGQDQEVRNREGSGLGLALVKYAVLAHQGKASVISQEGKGSEFRIELPLS